MMELDESKVKLAHEMAKKAHGGQLDKAGKDYIGHPEYVASLFETPKEKIIALLHDTLEDTDLSPECIKKEFGEQVLEAVVVLTKRKGEEYFSYIERVKAHPLARRIKIADLNHNIQIERLAHPEKRDYQRRKKYQEALRRLL